MLLQPLQYATALLAAGVRRRSRIGCHKTSATNIYRRPRRRDINSTREVAAGKLVPKKSKFDKPTGPTHANFWSHDTYTGRRLTNYTLRRALDLAQKTRSPQKRVSKSRKAVPYEGVYVESG